MKVDFTTIGTTKLQLPSVALWLTGSEMKPDVNAIITNILKGFAI